MGAETRTWRQRLADWWSTRQPVPMDQVSVARRVKENTDRHDATDTRVARLEAQLAECEARNAARIAGVFAVMDAAAKAAGDGHPDLEKTMPRGLYAVRDERQAG